MAKHLILFHSPGVCNEIERFWCHGSLKCFTILRPMENYVRLEYVLWKIFWFCSFSWFAFRIFIKLSDTNFNNHWNALTFFDQDVIKMRDLDFKLRWNTLIFLNKKNDVRVEYVLWKNVWFCFNSLVCPYFCRETERFWFYKSLKYFTIF